MTSPESPGYVRALKERWWITLLVLLSTVGASAFFTARQPTVFRSAVTLAVMPNTAVEGTADVLRSLETLERRSVIATFARIPSTPAARRAAAERVGLPGPDLERYRIEASVLPNTNILKVDVEGPDAGRVAELANAAAEITRVEARSLYRIFTMKVLAEATPSQRPVHPDPRRNALVAVLLGLFLGLLAAVAAGRLKAPAARGS